MKEKDNQKNEWLMKHCTKYWVNSSLLIKTTIDLHPTPQEFLVIMSHKIQISIHHQLNGLDEPYHLLLLNIFPNHLHVHHTPKH